MKDTIIEWNSEFYDEKYSFVYHYGKSLINLLDPKENQRILDVGCGSGQLTLKISKKNKIDSDEVHSIKFIFIKTITGFR